MPIAAEREETMYPGGKGSCYQKIINQMPPHDVYIEPFLGGGSVMRMKRPARKNIGLDLDIHALRGFAESIGADPLAVIDDGDDRRASIVTNADGISYELLCAEAVDWLEDYQWRGDELVYCDPPYPKGARRDSRDLYRFEMSDEAHQYLLTVIKQLPTRVIISSYHSKLYDSKLNDWRSLEFQAVTRGGSIATEVLWMNYPAPTELHDYRFLGDTFREREVIKRRKARWVKRLQKMNQLERFAMLAAIDEAFTADPCTNDDGYRCSSSEVAREARDLTVKYGDAEGTSEVAMSAMGVVK